VLMPRRGRRRVRWRMVGGIPFPAEGIWVTVVRYPARSEAEPQQKITLAHLKRQRTLVVMLVTPIALCSDFFN